MNEARTIERIKVDSQAFAAVGYDAARQLLSIEFNSGHIWHYRTIDNDAFQAFAGAPSRGSWFAKYIRGHFPGEPMTGICPSCARAGTVTIGLLGEQCKACKTPIVKVESHRKP